jgi:ATP-NAD kinase N-terminal domain
MGPIMPRIARARAESRPPRLILSRRPSRGEVEASEAFDEVFDQAVGHATIARMPALKPSGRLGLVLRPHSDPIAVVETLTAWAHSHGKRVIIDARDVARVPDGVEPVSAAQLVDQADALISLGGDGTLLGALRLVAQRPIPVLGVSSPVRRSKFGSDPGRVSWCGWTPRAISAAARSSSACSTYRSYPRRCAICSRQPSRRADRGRPRSDQESRSARLSSDLAFL